MRKNKFENLFIVIFMLSLILIWITACKKEEDANPLDISGCWSGRMVSTISYIEIEYNLQQNGNQITGKEWASIFSSRVFYLEGTYDQSDGVLIIEKSSGPLRYIFPDDNTMVRESGGTTTTLHRRATCDHAN